MHVSDTTTGFYSTNSGVKYNNVAWLESAIAHPALVLNDLASVVWPDDVTAPVAGCTQYFRDVMAG